MNDYSGYPTNLADKQRQVTEKVINLQERARKHLLLDIMNARKFEGVVDDITAEANYFKKTS